MSNSPQWKSFQPPPDTLNQDSIIDFKTMASNGLIVFRSKNAWNISCVVGKSSSSFSYTRSGSNSRFSQDFPLLGTEKPASNQMSFSNGLYGSASTTHTSSRNFPPIGTFSLDSNNVFNRCEIYKVLPV